MFDLFGGPPEDWEPIPAEILAEIPCLDETDAAPNGMAPALGHADDLVWHALDRTLGAETLPLLTAASLSDLSGAGLSLTLRRLDELSAHIEAVKAKVTAAIAGPKPEPGAQGRNEDFSPHEISVATRSSVYAADARIRLARDLAGRLAASAVALENGRMTYAQAIALSDATAQLPDDVTAQVEAAVLRLAHRHDIAKFKNKLRRALAAHDPNFTKKAKVDRAETVVAHEPGPHGTGDLFIRGPLEITTQISMILNAYAAKTKGQLPGTAADRKLAGLRDMVERYLASAEAPHEHGRLPILNICIDLATLLGLREGIAEIPGVGAIPADAARWLLADGAPFRRLIIDPDTGALLDYGRSTYTVPPDLADYLCAKNITSAAPHSNIPARGSDMEHNIPYDDGGHTNSINVSPIDRRWHRAKTFANWTYRKDPDGVITWTSPTGLACIIEPYDYRTGP